MTYDEPVEITVSVIDAPGKINEVTASVSVPDYASVELDEPSVTALKGKETGSFTFTIVPNSDLDDKAQDRPFNLVITVADSQKDKDGEASPLITTMTIPVPLGSAYHKVSMVCML
jgi:hypothetical protein